MVASIAFVAALTYGHLVVLPDDLTPKVMGGELMINTLSVLQPSLVTAPSLNPLSACAGLMLGYVYVAAAGWGTVGTYVPYLERLMLDYSGILSLVLFVIRVMFINYCQNLGLVHMNNYYVAMLAHVSTRMHEGWREHGNGTWREHDSFALHSCKTMPPFLMPAPPPCLSL